MHFTVLLMLLVVFCCLSAEAQPGRSRRRPMSFMELMRVRLDAKYHPTTPENARERFAALMSWAQLMMRGQMKDELDALLPREEAGRIDRLLSIGQADKAVPLIDDTFRRIEAAERDKRKKVPHGSVCGRVVDAGGNAVEGVLVAVYGTTLCDLSDSDGKFQIDLVPEAAPRYLLTASKAGYFESHVGDIDVEADGETWVTITMRGESPELWYLREKVRVCVGYLTEVHPGKGAREPDQSAVLDVSLYPTRVKPYLEPGNKIDSDHPAIRGLAAEILQSMPEAERGEQTRVAKAVYDWIVKNISYDLMRNYPGDVTCGNWQTTFGGWGRNFNNWCYLPSQVLREKRAICIEYERLATALLRALNIAARPAPLSAHPVTQWWVQLEDGSGYWANMETSVGHTLYAKKGDLQARFPSVNDSAIAFYAIDADAPIHMDWNADSPCLWLEDYGGRASFELSKNSLQDAKGALAAFARSGEIPAGERREAIPRSRDMREPYYIVQSRGFQIDLANIGPQRRLTARFPIFLSNQYRRTLDTKHWSSHPDWETRCWVEDETCDGTGETLSYYCIEFELGRVK